MSRIALVLLWCSLAILPVRAQADAGVEGAVAGRAANPIIQGGINAATAAEHVPGYTAKPPEANLAGQSNLGQAASAALARCATLPNDPVCQAELGAVASAHAPRDAVSASDPSVAAAHGITNQPASVLGDLSAFYAGCNAPGAGCPANVFCLGATCFDLSHPRDPDFARAMSLMEAGREAGVYLDTATMQVFNGETNTCRDRLLKNCCASDAAGAGMSNQALLGAGSRLVFDILMNSDNRAFITQGLQALLTQGGFSGSFTSYGITVAVNGTALPAGSITLATTDQLAIAFDPWSLALSVVFYVGIAMASCNAEEGKLALKEGAHLCHTIGTWCSSCLRVFGKCVACLEHSTAKCCFNSVLARLVNEQGRAQLGLGWGTAETPHCSGFTVAQLQSLDFAAMDLSEFYASIVPTLPNLANWQHQNASDAAALIGHAPPAPSPPSEPLPPPVPAPVPPAAPPPPAGPVTTAASCSYVDVRAAVATAPAGGTIRIPSGHCNWGTDQLTVPAGLRLTGAGKDLTVIVRDGPVSENQYLIAFDCSNGRQAMLSDVALTGNGSGAIWDKGVGLLHGCRDFRVFQSRFTRFTFSAVYVGDAPNQRGVIFSNDLIDNYSPELHNLGYGVVVYGGGAWPALDLGSPNAVFVEDNYFSGNRHNIASNNGSVYVFRHNTVVGQDPAKDFAMTDAHGLSSSPVGSRSVEIYDNTYSTHLNGGLQRSAIGIRGGDGVIFNNTVAGSISRSVELMTEGFTCGAYPGPYQIRSLYIWNNSAHPENGFTTNGIDDTCPASIQLNRDYFLTAKPGYAPYTYPHPLRATP